MNNCWLKLLNEDVDSNPKIVNMIFPAEGCIFNFFIGSKS